MFLRKKRKVADGETYEYWSLCRTVRTARGPRQEVVACLGKFDEEEVRSGGVGRMWRICWRVANPHRARVRANFLSASHRGVVFVPVAEVV